MAAGRKRRRATEYAITIIVVLTLNFLLPRLMPGDAFLILSGDDADPGSVYTAVQREYFRSHYGLDRPLPEQFAGYLTGLARGEWGQSYAYREPVLTVIARRLPWTLFLVGSALLLSLAGGILLGSWSAWRRTWAADRGLYLSLVVLGELPAFLTGLFFLMIFAAQWGLFPLSGAMTPFREYPNLGSRVLDILYHGVLPILTLTAARIGGVYLLVRSSLLLVLGRDYMQTARAKGLREYRIRYRHGLRSALLPLVTRLALQVGAMVGGTVLVENVFAYPGIGQLLADAVYMRDYPLLQGIVLVTACFVLVANIGADQLYQRLDPRIGAREEGSLNDKAVMPS